MTSLCERDFLLERVLRIVLAYAVDLPPPAQMAGCELKIDVDFPVQAEMRADFAMILELKGESKRNKTPSSLGLSLKAGLIQESHGRSADSLVRAVRTIGADYLADKAVRAPF